MGATPAEPAAAADAVAAGGATVPPPAQAHLVRLALGCLLIMLVVVSMAYGLAAARVPQHRAALEDLIRHETGLEVRFSELTVRWGWYGPEAVFHGVELSEPHREGVRLRAPQLVVGLDLWRMARSGRLEAGRITLRNPDIDLAAADGYTRGAARSPADVPRAGTRILSSWRGGQIDVEGGTLLTALPGSIVAVRFNIRHAQLRRLAGEWSADARVQLPETLGADAHLTLQLHGDPALPQGFSGTLSFEGRRLEFAGWRALAAETRLGRYLPQAGSGNLEVRATFARGQLLQAGGRIRAQDLEWDTPAAVPGALGLQQLRGSWQLARRGARWHLSVDALELGPPGETATPTPATLAVDLAADGAWARGRAQHAPLAVLAALASWFAPQLPFGEVALGGQARELSFAWSARRAAGARLTMAADLQDISFAAASGAVVLTGLSGRLSGTDTTLLADLRAHAAHLTVAHQPSYALDQLEVAAHLTAGSGGGGWLLSTNDLRVRRAGTTLTASGAIGAAAPQAPPLINARMALRDADVAVLASLLGPRALAAIGAAATHLTSGHIDSADFSWHGPLEGQPAWSVPGARFTGTATLRDASLVAGDGWPELVGIGARLEWRGPHVHADIERARSGGFRLTVASADWDTRSGHASHFAARVAGTAEEALAWLRAHPLAAGAAPGVADIDLRGAMLLDLDVTTPNPAPEPGAARPLVQVAAVLDGAALRPVSGLPPIAQLRGVVSFAGGHLQRSTLSGEWLGGPVSLGVGEHRERGQTLLAISGHGLMGARQALRAAGGSAHDVPLAGNAEWSALLTVVPGADGQHAWQLHADTNLVGVASRLPEPFAKPATAVLPVHLELQAGNEVGQLHVSLGERLAAVAALTRSGDTWRIERGAVRLAGSAPVLPAEAALLLDGRVSRLDLAACLALWRQAGADAALPELRARLTAAQLRAGARSYPEASLTASAAHGAGMLQVESAALSVAAHWPALIDAGHPATMHLVSFNLAQPADTALAAQLAAVLAPAMQLRVDDLRWQDRPLGSFAALLASHGEVLEASAVQLSGVSGETHASAHCRQATCEAKFSLESKDAAATLAAFGLRPQISARGALLEGELRWSPQADASLATLDGHLHMQLEDGMARVAADSGDAPFALLAVPALLAGMSADGADAPSPGLGFARLSADYELRDGVATTANLHFDGDAEILVRGRVGLTAGDYDAQAWVLRGEDRLPAAVRRLGPTPSVAAVWLSLRQLLGGAVADRAPGALRLRGTWNDPIVTPAE